MFRACKPSVPRTSIENVLPLRCPPPSAKPAAEPFTCFNPPHNTQLPPSHEQQLVKDKSVPTGTVPKENEQPSAHLPQHGPPDEMDIASLEMGWEYRTVLEPALTPEAMAEDLHREIRPERRVRPEDDPLLQDMLAFFSESQPKQ